MDKDEYKTILTNTNRDVFFNILITYRYNNSKALSIFVDRLICKTVYDNVMDLVNVKTDILNDTELSVMKLFCDAIAPPESELRETITDSGLIGIFKDEMDADIKGRTQIIYSNDIMNLDERNPDYRLKCSVSGNVNFTQSEVCMMYTNCFCDVKKLKKNGKFGRWMIKEIHKRPVSDELKSIIGDDLSYLFRATKPYMFTKPNMVDFIIESDACEDVINHINKNGNKDKKIYWMRLALLVNMERIVDLLKLTEISSGDTTYKLSQYVTQWRKIPDRYTF